MDFTGLRGDTGPRVTLDRMESSWCKGRGNSFKVGFQNLLSFPRESVGLSSVLSSFDPVDL